MYDMIRTDVGVLGLGGLRPSAGSWLGHG